jgi:hypothetical protein
MTPPTVQVQIAYAPATAAQMEAWRWLWGKLLQEVPRPADQAGQGHDKRAHGSADDGGGYHVTSS